MSAASRTFLLARYGVSADRVVSVDNGIVLPAATRPPAPNSPMRVLAVGSLNVQKGFETLIAAADLASERWTVQIAGEGPSRPRLETMIAELRAPASVELLGWRDDVLELTAAAHVVCVPSRWESAPYVAIDAMGMERPVIASAVDGLPEIVSNGATGELVIPQDPTALARALDRLAADPAARVRQGRAARRRVGERFTLAAMTDATLAVYEATRRG